MLDFMKVVINKRKDINYIKPVFLVQNSKDLMIRGGDFYAIWDESNSCWCTNEYRAVEIIDEEVRRYSKSLNIDGPKQILYLYDSDSGMIDKWNKFVKQQMFDTYVNLDEDLKFSNVELKREDYASRKLKYPLVDCPTPAYDNLMNVLYSEEERHKIEWAIGSVVCGASKNIQKFIVLYGAAGTGKSTVLNIIQDLFDGYYTVFDARALGSKSSQFSLEPFLNNPLVAIQHDGDLSKIEDNTKINSIVSHEYMTINAKYKSTFTARFNAFLFMGTNKPVMITDAKSGLLRRLIDVSPTGNKMSIDAYNNAMSQIKFELGGIAYHCMEVFKDNPNYYDHYIPTNMLGASNDMYNYVMEYYDEFSKDIVTLNRAWDLYKEYAEDANIPYKIPKRIFKEELRNYFDSFEERYNKDYTDYRNVYIGFNKDKVSGMKKPKQSVKSIKFEEQESIFDKEYSNMLAQYASTDEIPTKRWDDVTTKLSELDTHELHYVRLPKNHIVIDFDLKDKDGNKSFEKNLKEANKWPETYAELSKSGQGIHLHYIYDGDVSQLSRLYDEDIEIKIFTGKSSLRRKLTKCNNQPIRTINTGLPMKEAKVVNSDVIKNEKGLRALIIKNLNKEIHPATKPSIDFIYKLLNDAYANGMKYDVSDMHSAILSFAASSTHQSEYCIKTVSKMKFKSDEASNPEEQSDKVPIIFYDVEVFPNLFVIVWKEEGKPANKMINPTPLDVEELMKFRLVGFNCRRYDNHILWARYMGYNNLQLYNVSQRLIKGDKDAFFGEAYNVSYTDIYDYAAKKQSLKKWEIELGIHHQELGLPWDQPVPEEKWNLVADYCINDVVATEETWKATQGDFIARQMLVAMCKASGINATVNDTTNSLATKFIFGKERHPELVYTDLATGEQYTERS